MIEEIKEVVPYIKKHLEANPDWFPEFREMYLSICHNALLGWKISEKQKWVLIIGYNKIFDKVSKYDNLQDLPFGGKQ